MANRIRVYEIAKDLGVDSRVIISTLNELGMPVKNHMATLEPAALQAIKMKFGPRAKEAQSSTSDKSRAAAGPAAPSGGSRTPVQEKSVPVQPQRPRPAQTATGPNTIPPKADQKQTQVRTDARQQPARNVTGAAVSGKGQVPQRTGTAQRPGVPQKSGGTSHQTGASGDSRDSQGGRRPFQQSYPRRNDPRLQRRDVKPAKPDRGAVTGARRVTIQGPIPVRELAPLIGIPVGTVLRTLMSLGTLISINQSVPPEIAAKVAEKLGCVVTIKEPERSQEQLILEELERPDDPNALVPRPPIVTVMGHVDHGKTSLLDAIRHTNVTAKEAGGITQHIGASVVERQGVRLIFLDTPGHEAFTAMRARGAKVTDVAVLVVAADDGVMPQTIEAINHAKAAAVPIVVALNKMDKPGVKPDRVKQQLADAGLVPEEWGGDTVVVPVSAKTGEGIDDLFEMISLVAEMQEVKTDPTRAGRGYIIESQMDKGRGPVATALIKSGSLRVGDVIITDTTWGRIRAMYDARGRSVKKATPAIPVEIVGLESLPQAGDMFVVVQDEKIAKEVTERRQIEKREQEMNPVSRMTLEDLLKKGDQEEKRDMEIIVKADVQGSLEAILQALGKMKGGEVDLKVIHSGVGGIIASDVILAKASNATILGFNVRPDSTVRALAESEQIEIRTYRVIYDLLDDVEAMLKGLVKPKIEEVVLGRAEIRQTFHVPKVGTVAGCYVTSGKVSRQADVRLIRDGVVVYEGKMSSLKRFKDDVTEVSQGYECGIGLERYQDLKPGDIIEAYTTREIKPA